LKEKQEERGALQTTNQYHQEFTSIRFLQVKKQP